MNIESLHHKLHELGVSADKYFLHGRHGSTDDNDKLSMAVRMENYSPEYLIYYKERGEKIPKAVFQKESEACQYFYDCLWDIWIMEKRVAAGELSGMTVNEMLVHCDLTDLFYQYMETDKLKAGKILKVLGLNTEGIEQILYN